MMNRIVATKRLFMPEHDARARGARFARFMRRATITLASGFLLLLTFASSSLAATFTVNSSANSADANPGNGVCASSAATGGLCTLRAAIEETNALASGPHTINFNIPTTDSGYSTTRLIVVITVPAALPAITRADTTIDGTTQPNTRTGTLGTGGTVGVDKLSLQTVKIPDIEIVGTSAVAVGLDTQASGVTIRGLAIYGFGTTPNSATSGNIRIGNNFSGILIERNILGSMATSFTDPGAGVRSLGDNIRSAGADNVTVRNNLIGFSTGKGIGLDAVSTGWLVENNEARGNAIGNSNLDGIDIENGSGNCTVRGNLFVGNEAPGVDMYQSSGGNIVQNNTITGNGIGPNANIESPGVRLYGTGNSIDRNIINANYGAGVMVTSGSTQNTITRNSIFANGTIVNKSGAAASGQIGIDLLKSTDSQLTGTAPFVTPNDSGDTDAGGNDLINFPVMTSATISSGNLILTGYARPGASIELFVAASDPTGFGEGQTYLTTLVEGSGADTDTSSGTYTSPVNGLNVGTDTTNKFRFTIPVPSGVSTGTTLTATATLGGSTSEFSGNVVVRLPPAVALVKSVSPTGDQMPGADLTYTIAFSNTGGSSASSFIITDPIPASTDFKVGSVTTVLGTTGLTVVVAYSNDSGTTWTYTPASGGGGAPAGYDRAVTNVRWSFGGNLSQTPPNNAGSVTFTVRIR